MKFVFADTYYFIALLSPDDYAHRQAVAFSESGEIALLTTAWVMTELADGLSRTQNRYLFAKILFDIEQHAHHAILPPSEALFRKGIDLFERRRDKSWSLTDCISFVVMKEHGVIEALTGDHHFEQAGFVPLLA